jgi:hypothetical protein
MMGKPDSSVVMGVSDWGVTGYIQDGKNIYIIAEDHKGTTYVNKASKDDLPLATFMDTVLQVPKDERQERRLTPEDHLRGRHTQTVEERCYTVAIDTLDDFLYGSSAQQKMNYAYTIMAATSLLFAGIQDWKTNYHIGNANFQMYLSVGYIRVYANGASDWYNPSRACSGGIIDGTCLLTDSRSYWSGNSSPTIPAYHVLITMTQACNPFGGVAWLDAICSSYKYAIAGCLEGSFPLPVEPDGVRSPETWDLVVVAHELGHSFGSPHTHDFSPAIDTCAFYTPDCGSNIPEGGGTIMSYCHGCYGGMSNIDVRFHTLVLDRIASARLPYSDNCAPTALNGRCSDLIDTYYPYLPGTCTQDENCAHCFDAERCELCNQGYNLDNNGNCIPICEVNCDVCSSPTDCTQCSFGYQNIFQQAGDCAPSVKTIIATSVLRRPSARSAPLAMAWRVAIASRAKPVATSALHRLFVHSATPTTSSTTATAPQSAKPIAARALRRRSALSASLNTTCRTTTASQSAKPTATSALRPPSALSAGLASTCRVTLARRARKRIFRVPLAQTVATVELFAAPGEAAVN